MEAMRGKLFCAWHRATNHRPTRLRSEAESFSCFFQAFSPCAFVSAFLSELQTEAKAFVHAVDLRLQP